MDTAGQHQYHTTYMSAQPQKQFIQQIGKKIQKQIIEGIKEAGMFSVTVDITPKIFKMPEIDNNTANIIQKSNYKWKQLAKTYFEHRKWSSRVKVECPSSKNKNKNNLL